MKGNGLCSSTKPSRPLAIQSDSEESVPEEQATADTDNPTMLK